ncbi:hypothetical protein [Microbulbifer litoralis]|uniref:hypothetical protein n=1 Tax=Microbulbifer litoralis TaxID=2933965 RepID=UPI002028897C|nr:hypothetical protein [Microbulbifer sp. GX H0434]
MNSFLKYVGLHSALFVALGTITSGAQAGSFPLGTLPGGTTCSGVAINNSGTVVGHCDDATGRTVAIRKRIDQPIEQLPTMANNSCRVIDVSNINVASGECTDASGEVLPVRWEANGVRQTLQPIPGLLGLLADVSATGGPINYNRWVIGSSYSANGQARPVVWRGNQVTPEMLPLIEPLTSGGLDAVHCEPVALNDNTLTFNGPIVVGTCSVANASGVVRSMAVYWRRPNGNGNYAVNVLDSLGADSNCRVVDVNNAGDITGVCTDANDEEQAVFWAAGGVSVQSVAALIPGGSARSSAVAINGTGWIAGTFRAADGYDHAFAWDPLNSTFEEIVPPSGLYHSRAADISDSQNVVVGTVHEDGNVMRGFSWTQSQGVNVLPAAFIPPVQNIPEVRNDELLLNIFLNGTVQALVLNEDP